MYDNVINLDIARNVFGNDEELYKHYLFQFVQRDLLGQMEQFISDKKTNEAFEVAHIMKGLVQNLGLTEFGEVLRDVVDQLRNGTIPTEDQNDILKEKYNNILNYIAYVKDNEISIFG